MEREVESFRTAINRKNLSVPMRILKEGNHISKSDKILDMGCGKHTDVDKLSEEGYDVVGYDKHNEVYCDDTLLDVEYDVVVCNYVFNVIPCLKEHQALLDDLRRLSTRVYVSVRADTKAVRDTWVYDSECLGYFTTRKTFQRFYDKDMIESMFGEVDIIEMASSYVLFRLR